MNKRNEGYALVLVLVVMVVLCLVAVSILSISASNLKKQQDSIERMQAKFEAQGKLEQVLSIAEKEFSKYAGYKNDNLKAACNTVDGVELVQGLSYTADAVEVKTEGTGEPKEYYDTLTFSLLARSGSAQIRCSIVITGEIEDSLAESAYTIKNYTMEYISYEITFTEPTEGGAAQ